jgi:glycolate oxidase iron-sulfur subunit
MSLESTNLQAELQHITPPSEGPLRRQTHTYDLIRQCIHCGFCLPTCPTYAVLGVEMDSPRGRIYQMQAIADGRLEISTDFVEHINCCLGCRACETACPSGVQFGKLIEAAREQIQIEIAHTPLFFESGASGAPEETRYIEPSAKGDEDLPSYIHPHTTPPLENLTARLLRRLFFFLVLP